MITIDFSHSPKGKECISMKITGEEGKENEWILLTARRAPIAGRLLEELTTRFQAEALSGPPLDWYRSLVEHKLVFHSQHGAIGIYVQAEKFDFLAMKLQGQL